jgi:3,4-dihydroxy-2-butanone 4-phosphate synthase
VRNQRNGLQGEHETPNSEELTEPRIDGAFVAIVETGNGHYRRRVYLSLGAAEAAVRRARNAGVRANVVICELRILGAEVE